MEESNAEWLRKKLMRIGCEDAGEGMQLDADTIASLVSYCELAPPDDAAEYITNIFVHESCKDIADEYLKRRRAPPSMIRTETGTSMQAYQKSQAEDNWSVKGKKALKQQQKSPVVQEQKLAPSSNSAASSTTRNPAVAPAKVAAPEKRSSNRKGKKTMTMTEASKVVSFQQGRPCDCQATKHGLINNCLSCGKIVCQQEGEGPCNFCGALVLREGSSYAGLEGVSVPGSEAEAAAEAFKDRLVEYDRNSASRTTVIDDQSDFVDADADVWMSEEDKVLLRRKQEEMERAEEERKKRVVVTIDLLGRKVVMAGGEGSKETLTERILMDLGGTRPAPSSIPASPSIKEAPVYIDPGHMRGSRQKPNFAVTGRVQYDDNIVGAQLGRKLESLHLGEHEWCRPKLRQSASQDASESFECA